MRYPLVDGQGNFGSIDGDPPAAMRYTEARMTPSPRRCWPTSTRRRSTSSPNYDGTRQEPTVLPAQLPQPAAATARAGIAVGMATNIPPHNLSEVVRRADPPDRQPRGPGRGAVRVRQGAGLPHRRAHPGHRGHQDRLRHRPRPGRHARQGPRSRSRAAGRFQIIVTELPYQVNKATLIEKIAELVKEKRIEGISDLRDESDRQGMRIVIELKRDAKPQAVLNQLYKHTAMQTTFGVNMLALVDGQPRVLTLKKALQHFIDHRQEVITRRTQFELEKAQASAPTSWKA